MRRSLFLPFSLLFVFSLLGFGCVKKSTPSGGNRGPSGGGSTVTYCSDPTHASSSFCKDTGGKTVGTLGDQSYTNMGLKVNGSDIVTEAGSKLLITNKAGWQAGWQVPLPTDFRKVDDFHQTYHAVNKNGKALDLIRVYYDQDGKQIVEGRFTAGSGSDPSTGFITEGSIAQPALVDGYAKLKEIYEVIYFGEKIVDGSSKLQDAQYYYVMPVMHINIGS